MQGNNRLTSLYGFAMKLGVMPCFIPTLLATNLNKTALSAIRPESVYAKAVSKTPGPVSVSTDISSSTSPELRREGKLTMRFYLDSKVGSLVIELVVVVHIQRSSEHRVPVHCESACMKSGK
jgi:hypothetical protein